MDAAEITRATRRIAHEIIEANHGTESLLVLGIPTRGPALAHRIAAEIGAAEGGEVPVGEIDITMYRDDLRRKPPRPLGRTVIPGEVDGRVVVLVDDVLFSGRTVAAALDALKDLGRPTRVLLAVLVDRGHRELPIAADFVGRHLATDASDRVKVSVVEVDGTDAVTIEKDSHA